MEICVYYFHRRIKTTSPSNADERVQIGEKEGIVEAYSDFKAWLVKEGEEPISVRIIKKFYHNSHSIDIQFIYISPQAISDKCLEVMSKHMDFVQTLIRDVQNIQGFMKIVTHFQTTSVSYPVMEEFQKSIGAIQIREYR